MKLKLILLLFLSTLTLAAVRSDFWEHRPNRFSRIENQQILSIDRDVIKYINNIVYNIIIMHYNIIMCKITLLILSKWSSKRTRLYKRG